MTEHFQYLIDIDTTILRAINQLSGHSIFLDQLMILISSGLLWECLGVVALILICKSGNANILSGFLFGLVALGAADLISFEIVKPFIARERPCWALENLNLVLGFCGGSYGFTSNHAANAAAFAFALIRTGLFNSAISTVAINCVILVGFSRVYLGVHYPGDVFGGFFLGIFVTILLHALKIDQLTNILAKNLLIMIAGFRRNRAK